MTAIQNISLFLLDMDGTIYFEDRLIPGALEFITKLDTLGKRYIFLTNNSSVSKEIYLEKLKRMGIPCHDETVFSSGMAMGMYLSQSHPGKTIYLVGTKALEKEIASYGVKITECDPDIVVVGYDRELNYQKLEKACAFLDSGAKFYATNPDLLYPIKNSRYLPDCGSICHMLTVATKKAPIYIGKPNRYMVDILLQRYDIGLNQTAIVGDRLYTDIATGINSGILSICVLSGETTKEMLQDSDIKPDFVTDSVRDLISQI